MLSVYISSMLDHFVYLNTAIQFKDTLRLPHLLTLNKRKFHRPQSEHRELPLQQKNSGRYKNDLKEIVPGKISIGTTKCPYFYAFIFSDRGLIILETEAHSTKSLIGTIECI